MRRIVFSLQMLACVRPLSIRLSLFLFQVCTGPVVSLLAVTAELDHSTVLRLEAWLKQRKLEAEAWGLASRTQAATAGASDHPVLMADAADTGAGVPKAAESEAQSARGDEGTEGQASLLAAMSAHATTIQAQVLGRVHA